MTADLSERYSDHAASVSGVGSGFPLETLLGAETPETAETEPFSRGFCVSSVGFGAETAETEPFSRGFRFSGSWKSLFFPCVSIVSSVFPTPETHETPIFPGVFPLFPVFPGFLAFPESLRFSRCGQ
jgi:hypothetical protein